MKQHALKRVRVKLVGLETFAMLGWIFEFALQAIDLIAQCVRRFDKLGTVGDARFKINIVPGKKIQFRLPSLEGILVLPMESLVYRAHNLPSKSRRSEAGVSLSDLKILTLGLNGQGELSG
jgi:hypothetical protein